LLDAKHAKNAKRRFAPRKSVAIAGNGRRAERALASLAVLAVLASKDYRQPKPYAPV